VYSWGMDVQGRRSPTTSSGKPRPLGNRDLPGCRSKNFYVHDNLVQDVVWNGVDTRTST